MIFKYLFDPALSQASYLIGCQATGEAIVIDPLRDVDRYIDLAAREGVRIVAVTETHIHADYCSGTRELALRTSAQIYLSGCGPEEWRYQFAVADRVIEVTDGQVISVGNIRLKVRYTPGHTPEHICFLVKDGAVSDKPMGMLTGDFLFVGDVGRPDLLETVAHEQGSMETSARALYHSLQALHDLPDYLQIWPGHGAGSACGRALGAVPQSTLGYERLVNWALQPQTEAVFVTEVLRGQPEPPAYFAVMKQVNRDGPAPLGGLPVVPHRSGFEAQQWSEQLGLVIDARDAEAFAERHLRASLNIPGTPTFASWFGSLVDYGSSVWLLSPDEAQGERLVRELMSIGYDRIVGVSVANDALEGVDTWAVPQRSAVALSGALGRDGLTVLDVRNLAEWATGHVRGALHIPLPELPRRLDELPIDGTIVTMCASGARSAIAASLLLLAGAPSVENLDGGMQAWTNGGLTVTTDDALPDRRVPVTDGTGPEIPVFVDRRKAERSGDGATWNGRR